MVPVGAVLPLIVRFADTPQEKALKQQLRSQAKEARFPMLNPTFALSPAAANGISPAPMPNYLAPTAWPLHPGCITNALAPHPGPAPTQTTLGTHPARLLVTGLPK